MPKAKEEKVEEKKEHVNVISVDISREMKESFIDYAMSVITDRALPDVRDGLKPVQRRILYAAHILKLTSTGDYVKSARIVGDTMGKYHPHGRQALCKRCLSPRKPENAV